MINLYNCLEIVLLLHSVLASIKVNMDFFEVFKPFYIFSKIIGLYSFNASYSQGRFSFGVSIMEAAYSILVSLSPLVFALHINNYNQPIIPVGSAMINLWTRIAQIGIFLPICQVCYRHIKSKSTAIFLKKVIEFDEKCRKIGIFIGYKVELKRVKLAVLSVFCFMLVISTLPLSKLLFNLPAQFDRMMSHGAQYFYMYYGTIEMVVVMRSVDIRIKKSNKYLEKTMFTSKRQLKHFLKLVNELCDLIDHLNSTFSMNMIFVLTNILAMGTIGVYTVILGFVSFNMRFLFMVVNTFMWILFQLGMVYMIANAGWQVRVHLGEISSTAVKKLNSSMNETINNELRDLIQQLKCRDSKIECLLFTIDWGVVIGVR